jgi:hypothetical protein
VSTTSLSRRAAVVAVSTACLFPTIAAARPADGPADHPGVKIAATKPADPQGDSPSQYAAVTGAPRTGATAAVRGDSPSQYAAVTGAPSAPLEIVQPERTIVRDRVPSAPLVLAGLALVVALIGAVDLRARRRTVRFH